jgi:hypothetical protein
VNRQENISDNEVGKTIETEPQMTYILELAVTLKWLDNMLKKIEKRWIKWRENFYTKESVKVTKLVTHACNPSYSGGRDQEDHSLKPALGE